MAASRVGVAFFISFLLHQKIFVPLQPNFKSSHNEKANLDFGRWSIIVRGLLQRHNRNTNQAITISCPSNYVGESGKFLTVFTFSSSAQWQTNVTLAASNGTSTISSVAINNVPIQRNRSTEYSGNLFTNNGSTALTLNDTWGDPFIGTW